MAKAKGFARISVMCWRLSRCYSAAPKNLQFIAHCDRVVTYHLWEVV
jgi:hypothetical protein